MRAIVSMLVAMCLAACTESDGGDAQFTMQVDAPATKVIAGLGQFDGGSMPRLLGIKPPAVTGQGDGVVRATIMGEGSEKGIILFSVETTAPGQSQLDVDIDLPETITRPDGQTLQVRGRHAAETLRTALAQWAKSLAKDDVKRWDVGKVNTALTSMAIVLSPHREAELREILRTGGASEYARTQSAFHGQDTSRTSWHGEDKPEGFGPPKGGDWGDNTN